MRIMRYGVILLVGIAGILLIQPVLFPLLRQAGWVTELRMGCKTAGFSGIYAMWDFICFYMIMAAFGLFNGIYSGLLFGRGRWSRPSLVSWLLLCLAPYTVLVTNPPPHLPENAHQMAHLTRGLLIFVPLNIAVLPIILGCAWVAATLKPPGRGAAGREINPQSQIESHK